MASRFTQDKPVLNASQIAETSDPSSVKVYGFMAFPLLFIAWEDHNINCGRCHNKRRNILALFILSAGSGVPANQLAESLELSGGVIRCMLERKPMPHSGMTSQPLPFLLHIRPRFFANSLQHVELVAFAMDELKLRLRSGIELRTGSPYRNKAWRVGCRKVGRKATDGLLFDLPSPPLDLHTTAVWAIDAERVVTQHTHYTLLDTEFPAASDDMTLWYARSSGGREFALRWPDWAQGLTPAKAGPRMELSSDTTNARRRDRLDKDGVLVERYEEFDLVTIEPDRLINADRDANRPQLSDAIKPENIREQYT